jgi:glucokinase
MVVHVGTMVGRAVASVANLLDLQLALVAGSVALGFGAPFFAAAQAELDRCACLDFSASTRIRPAGLGDRGPLVGAGAVGWRGLGVDVLAGAPARAAMP